MTPARTQLIAKGESALELKRSTGELPARVRPNRWLTFPCAGVRA
jgi:hypothetical protein